MSDRNRSSVRGRESASLTALPGGQDASSIPRFLAWFEVLTGFDQALNTAGIDGDTHDALLECRAISARLLSRGAMT